MDNDGETAKRKAINIRMPVVLIEKVAKIAEHEKKDKSDIHIKAIEEFTEKYHSRVCQGCHTINPPDSHFCNNCGLPMDPEGLAEFQRIREYIAQNPRILLDNYNRLKSSEE